MRVAKELSRRPDWSRLLSAVATPLKGNIVLRRVTLSVVAEPSKQRDANGQLLPGKQETVLAIHGYARNQAAVPDYVLSLERTELFEVVKLIDARGEPFAETTVVSFNLRCVMKATSPEQAGGGS